MAHFAQINSYSIVTEVVTINNDVIDNLPFPESEPVGVEFCKELYGAETVWVQTSYNGNFRYNYAGINYLFDPTPSPYGAFIPPAPYPSWLLDTNTYQWYPPVPYPSDGKQYYWDEATQSWAPAPPPPPTA